MLFAVVAVPVGLGFMVVLAFVAALFALRLVLHHPLMLGVTACLIGMPIAMNFTLFSAQYGKDQTLAASAVFLTTLLSVFTIPVLCSFLI